MQLVFEPGIIGFVFSDRSPATADRVQIENALFAHGVGHLWFDDYIEYNDYGGVDDQLSIYRIPHNLSDDELIMLKLSM